MVVRGELSNSVKRTCAIAALACSHHSYRVGGGGIFSETRGKCNMQGAMWKAKGGFLSSIRTLFHKVKCRGHF